MVQLTITTYRPDSCHVFLFVFYIILLVLIKLLIDAFMSQKAVDNYGQ